MPKFMPVCLLSPKLNESPVPRSKLFEVKATSQKPSWVFCGKLICDIWHVILNKCDMSYVITGDSEGSLLQSGHLVANTVAELLVVDHLSASWVR